MNEVNVHKQRAVLMGLLCCILKDQEGCSAETIKKAIIEAFTYIIDAELHVGDFIEMQTMQTCLQFCEQQKALEDAIDILENK